MKIALTSNGPLAGKSTLARYLQWEYGFVRADHSRTLVDNYVGYMSKGRPGLTVEGVYADKEQHRQGLQEHGYRVGFNNPERAAYWIKQTLSRSGCPVLQPRCPGCKPVVCPKHNVVFDSFRGEGQAQVLRDLGFVLVQLMLTDTERCKRALAMGKYCEELSKAMHAAPELELGIAHPDLYLNADEATEILARIVTQGRETNDVR